MTSAAPPSRPDRYRGAFFTQFTDRVDRSLSLHPLLWLLAFTAIYLLAAAAGSLIKPLWFDELFTFYISRQPRISDVLRVVPLDSHPPLTYLVTHFSQRLFGLSDLATRIPEIIGVWLLCFCLYLFVRRSARPLFALFAALVPIGTGVFSYAVEARPYALVLGLAGLALISWQAAICGSHRKLGLAGLTLSIGAALCCHYYALLAIAFPIAVGEVARTFSRKRIDWAVWTALALSAAPIIWLWPQAMAASAVFSDHILKSPVFWAKPTPVRLFDFYSDLLAHSILPAVIALAAAVLAGMHARSSPAPVAGHAGGSQAAHELVAALGFMLVPVVLLVFARWRTGYFMDRYAITAVLGVAILAAYLLSAACSWPEASVFVLAFVVSVATLRSLNIARLADFRHPRAANVYAPGTLPVLGIAGTLPVVVSNPLLFLQTARYASPDVLSRMVYLSDVSFALRQPDPVPEIGLAGARSIMPGHIEEYSRFLQDHDRFWVYYSGNPGMEWLPAGLLAGGYGLRVSKLQGNATLFYASRPGVTHVPSEN